MHGHMNVKFAHSWLMDSWYMTTYDNVDFHPGRRNETPL